MIFLKETYVTLQIKILGNCLSLKKFEGPYKETHFITLVIGAIKHNFNSQKILCNWSYVTNALIWNTVFFIGNFELCIDIKCLIT